MAEVGAVQTQGTCLVHAKEVTRLAAVGGPRLDPVMIVEPVVPMLGDERGPLYHLLHLYWF
jgi:hypothetical protein